MRILLTFVLSFALTILPAGAMQRGTFYAQNRPHAAGAFCGGSSGPTCTQISDETGTCVAVGANQTCSIPTVNTVGDVIFGVCVGPRNGTIMEDDNGETWVPVGIAVPFGPQNHATLSVAIVQNAGPDNLDCTNSATSGFTVVAIARGVRSSTGWNQLDPSSNSGPPVTNVTTQCSVSLTGPQAQTHEYIYAWCGTDNAPGPDPDSAVGFTLLTDYTACNNSALVTEFCSDFQQSAPSSGVVTGITIAVPGSGYNPGDMLEIQQGSNTSAYLVVNSTGLLTSATIVAGGIGYTAANNLPLLTKSGSGATATVNITVGNTASFVTPDSGVVNLFTQFIAGMQPN